MRSHRLVVTSLSVLALAALAAGCMERDLGRLRPRLGFGQEVRVGTGGFRNVDLLLVVDDSHSMEQEQENLAEQIPLLVRDLTSPPDLDGNGSPDWGAAERVRIAVVNTDLGTAGATPPPGIGERCNGFGENGEWRTSDACGATAGLQVFEAGMDGSAYATRIGCLVESLGLTGCGIEQQLGAAARGVEFGASAGFPADDAIFAVLLLTDEEDCTLADPGAFFGAFTASNGNVLCQRAAQDLDGASSLWLSPIDDLVGRMMAGRDADGFVFAAITGIPPEAQGLTPAQILADPDMQYAEQTSPIDGRTLEPVPACQSDLGRASPARRVVQVAAEIPGSVLHSICTDDFRPAVQELVARIAERLPGVCLTRAIPRVGDRVDCRVADTLPAGTTCASVAGHRLEGVTEDGREICLIDQVVPGGPTDGFFYDDSDAACAQLRFTERSVPPLGSQVEVDCYFEVPSEDPGPITP